MPNFYTILENLETLPHEFDIPLKNIHELVMKEEEFKNFLNAVQNSKTLTTARILLSGDSPENKNLPDIKDKIAARYQELIKKLKGNTKTYVEMEIPKPFVYYYSEMRLQQLLNALYNNPSLRTLDLSNLTLGQQNLTALLNSTTANPSLITRLTLDNNLLFWLDKDSSQALAAWIASFKNLTHLSLRNNHFELAEHLTPLKKAIRQHPTLQKLNSASGDLRTALQANLTKRRNAAEPATSSYTEILWSFGQSVASGADRVKTLFTDCFKEKPKNKNQYR